MLDKILEFIPPIPIAEKTKDFTDWLTETFAFLFDPIKEYFGSFMEFASETLLAVPPIIIIIIVALLAFFISGKKFGLAAFSIVGLWLVYNQGDRKSTRLNSSHVAISYADFCLKKKKNQKI